MPPVMVRETSFLEPFYTKNDRFTMTGSRQTSGKHSKKEWRFSQVHGTVMIPAGALTLLTAIFG
jgi:hypothetical protein